MIERVDLEAEGQIHEVVTTPSSPGCRKQQGEQEQRRHAHVFFGANRWGLVPKCISAASIIVSDNVGWG